jgi:peptidoglycan/LPS O-acetylase OafA/YrhL
MGNINGKSQPVGAATNRFVELDALRGIAAIMVMTFHFTAFGGWAPFQFNLGATWVEFFFILSGFVILMTLDKGPSVKAFFLGRLVRIVPAYWACATFTLLAILIHGGEDPSTIFSRYLWNLTMVNSYFRVENLDGPYWTLIIEWLFYALMGIIIGFRALRHIELIGFVVLLFSAAYATPYFQAHFSSLFYTLKGYFPLFNHFAAFYTGIVLYRVRTHGGKSWRYPLAALALFVETLSTEEVGRAINFVSQWEYNALIVMYGVIMIAFLENKLGFVANKITLYLGRVSYPLFLIHQFLGTIILIPFFCYNLGWNFWLAYLMTVLICVGFASVIHFKIEVPLSKKIKQLIGMTSAHAPVKS